MKFIRFDALIILLTSWAEAALAAPGCTITTSRAFYALPDDTYDRCLLSFQINVTRPSNASQKCSARQDRLTAVGLFPSTSWHVDFRDTSEQQSFAFAVYRGCLSVKRINAASLRNRSGKVQLRYADVDDRCNLACETEADVRIVGPPVLVLSELVRQQVSEKREVTIRDRMPHVANLEHDVLLFCCEPVRADHPIGNCLETVDLQIRIFDQYQKQYELSDAGATMKVNATVRMQFVNGTLQGVHEGDYWNVPIESNEVVESASSRALSISLGRSSLCEQFTRSASVMSAKSRLIGPIFANFRASIAVVVTSGTAEFARRAGEAWHMNLLVAEKPIGITNEHDAPHDHKVDYKPIYLGATLIVLLLLMGVTVNIYSLQKKLRCFR